MQKNASAKLLLISQIIKDCWMALEIGDAAPDFSLSDTHGNLVKLSDLKGKRVVLYFYPRDNTPGCTKEGHQHRRRKLSRKICDET